MKNFLPLIILILTLNTISPAQDSVVLRLRIYLQGAYNNGLMIPLLNQKGLIPLVQPFNRSPWEYKGNEKAEKISESIIDWVLVELRKNPEQLTPAARKAFLLNSNGNIIDTDGSNNLTFRNIKKGEYYIVIIHRNHLPLISASPVSLSGIPAAMDFTADPSAVSGNSTTLLENNLFGMRSGDGDLNGVVDDHDFKRVASEIFRSGYLDSDYDMNGVVNVLDYSLVNKNLNKTGILID